MSPILVRPVREQFEHDRVIRVLQTRYQRKFEVAINPGAEQNASVTVGELPMYPDLILYSQDRGRKVQATIEVETVESINTLEAMAEWVQFSKLRGTPFYLYVPPNMVDTVRRLCTEHQVPFAEIWTYHTAVDQIRFTMVYRGPDAPRQSAAMRAMESDEPMVPAMKAKPLAAAPLKADHKPAATVIAKPGPVKTAAPAKPVSKKPLAKKPLAKKPLAKKPAAKKTIVRKSATKKATTKGAQKTTSSKTKKSARPGKRR
ncbi:MAG TPA: hypothetical protein VNJ02_13080 [Vicinamibacterales bacterium]|nr:hypothetical protein [Vicinamibacterales bacterium]